MAYNHKRDYENAIRKVTIKFGTKLNCETDDDAVIIVREPSELEALEWNEARKEGSKSSMEAFKKILGNSIVKHNLMEDDVKPMSNEAVADLIYQKIGLCNYVVEQWTKQVFTSPTNSKEGK